MSFRSFLSQQMQRASAALSDAAHWLYTGGGAARSSEPVLDEYIVGMPSAQNAVDILPGWTHPVLPPIGASAASQPAYNDPRICWAIEQYGPLARRKILELGPREAAQTFMLDRCDPEFIHSIEANKLAYLRCLVVKEILDIKRAAFFLGDALLWLEDATKRYDFIVACGALVEMADRVRAIELMAARADAIYLWMPYSDANALAEGEVRQPAEVHGIPVRLHARSDGDGMHELHRWMEKDDIVAILRALGLDDIRIAHDEPGQPNGPGISVFARRMADAR